jgi:hypothetical protein
MKTTSDTSTSGWRSALIWGFGAALAQRLLLGIWMAGVWLAGGSFFAETADFQTKADSMLPPLDAMQELIFGVWRRWDAIHYLDVALNGFIPQNEPLSVFPPLTAWGIRAFASVFPPLDLGAMIFSTLAFGLALTFLYRMCQVYLRDEGLAPWAVALTALLPLGHFFSAPMSEGIYLAMTLGTFYFAARSNLWAAALCGFLATMARTQGVLLAPIALLILLEQHWHLTTTWRARAALVIRHGYPLVLIPAAVLLYNLYRSALGFRPLDVLYREMSYRFFVNPLEGLWINLRYLATADPWNVDGWAVVITLLLCAAFVVRVRMKNLPLTFYTLGFVAVFLTPINYQYGTDMVTNTQSFGRYALILFPLTLMVADILRQSGKWVRLAAIAGLLFLTLGLSARHVLGILGP